MIEAHNITKYFGLKNKKSFKALDNVSLNISKGEFAVISGRSGSGKSTLLYILSAMDNSYEGTVWLDDQKLSGMNDRELSRIRNRKLGFVFQFHFLLPHFSVLQNVLLPAMKNSGISERECRGKALEKLQWLGIEHLADMPSQKLSGGQQQRVAIARALMNEPDIIMADEPTGNLDRQNSELVFQIFRRLRSEKNKTILVVTHDKDLAQTADRVIYMEDGKILNPDHYL
ncbi:MAG: ABC transporter ATP-binding protein [Cytophagaceae bacterium]|nr:ABC transporter ATP-binding protein [Cytophagaceae bacterium]MDW8455437.1 ABC transporter ATP-binding protein [Cytophagaceae bacterium]